MVDFSLSDEERQIRDTVRSFIEKEVMPLEPEVLRNERAGQPGGSTGPCCATCRPRPGAAASWA